MLHLLKKIQCVILKKCPLQKHKLPFGHTEGKHLDLTKFTEIELNMNQHFGCLVVDWQGKLLKILYLNAVMTV